MRFERTGAGSSGSVRASDIALAADVSTRMRSGVSRVRTSSLTSLPRPGNNPETRVRGSQLPQELLGNLVGLSLDLQIADLQADQHGSPLPPWLALTAPLGKHFEFLGHPHGGRAADPQSVMKGQPGGVQLRVRRHQVNCQDPIPQADLGFLDDGPLADAEMSLAVSTPVELGRMTGVTTAREESPFRSTGRAPDLCAPPDGSQPQSGTMLVGNCAEEFRKSHERTCGGAAATRPLQGCHRETRGNSRVVTVR